MGRVKPCMSLQGFYFCGLNKVRGEMGNCFKWVTVPGYIFSNLNQVKVEQ